MAEFDSREPSEGIDSPEECSFLDPASDREEPKADITRHDRFELLSAYLDEEVTPEEQALVQHWLSSDPVMRSHYQKQLMLRAAIKNLLS